VGGFSLVACSTVNHYAFLMGFDVLISILRGVDGSSEMLRTW
jgi:hypothetical protein